MAATRDWSPPANCSLNAQFFWIWKAISRRYRSISWAVFLPSSLNVPGFPPDFSVERAVLFPVAADLSASVLLTSFFSRSNADFSGSGWSAASGTSVLTSTVSSSCLMARLTTWVDLKVFFFNEVLGFGGAFSTTLAAFLTGGDTAGFFFTSAFLIWGGLFPTAGFSAASVAGFFKDTMLTLITERAWGLSDLRLGVTTKSTRKTRWQTSETATG